MEDETSPLLEMRRNRKFSEEYKRKVLAEIDSAPREDIKKILTREKLTHAHVRYWRKQLTSAARLPSSL